MKKRNFRGFFKGEKGQRIFNYAYSLGASVVILGALFKLLHVPGADFMLILGMGTEAVIFALSAFDEPAKDYKWEKVYPELDIPNTEEAALERLERMKDGNPVPRRHSADEVPAGNGGSVTIIGGGMPSGGTIVIGGGSGSGEASAATVDPSLVNVSTSTGVSGGVPAGIIGGGSAPMGSLSPEQATEVAQATEKYVNQLNEISAILAKLQESMSSLEGTSGYAEQMASLNRNVQGLNTIYEIQLKSVSSQLGTIEQVNQGLNNIRSLYENGQNDSFRIRQETDQLARNLQLLNEVYARMLQAMTSGYGFQPAQQPQAYPQQPTTPQQPLYAQQQPQQFGQQR